MSDLPPHLGGHGNETHVDQGVADYLIDTLGIQSALDVGCGVGDMVGVFARRGLLALGIDGDWTVPRPPDISVLIHDFTQPLTMTIPEFDLCWSVEFVEHVEEQFMKNYLDVFARCRYVVMTHAVPDQCGHHHVNCRTPEYWKDVMKNIGFGFDDKQTEQIRSRSTMKADYMRKQGLFFRR
jgi:SAM-dependent methyltransferase